MNKISVVIPIFNEEDNIRTLYGELKKVLSDLGKEYEIIYVDDCSQDKSLSVLKELLKDDERVEVVSLLGNHGQTLALNAGFHIASGDIVVAMDGDGQHNPKYIPQFVAHIENGYDVVSSWKERDKQASKLKFILSKFAHRMIGKISGVNMRYFGATMKAYRRDVLEGLDLSGELHRFAGALISFRGIKIIEVPIEIRPRDRGKSNYSLNKIVKVALDLILIKFLMNYAKRPFRMFGLSGVVLGIFGSAGLFYVFLTKYFLGIPTSSRTSILVVSAILIMTGVQFVFFGLIAELISRVYYTSGEKNFYKIRTRYSGKRD